MGGEVQPPQPQPAQQQQVSYTVEQLVAFNPYNPDILPDLENYDQRAGLFSNLQPGCEPLPSSPLPDLDLLMLYLQLQFEPERMSTQIVSCILIKALMAMPAPDFSLCLFLIPEKVQMQEPFKSLVVLSYYLETGRFLLFWDEAAKSRHLLEAVPGFEQAIQTHAVHVLSLTLQKVPRAVLAEAIDIEGPSLDKFIEHQVVNCRWAIDKVQLIIISQNEFNHPELKKSSAETVPLEHITRTFAILA